MIKNLILLFLIVLLFSCKKEDENLDLKYEVLNQIISEDILENKASGYTEKYLYKISKPIDLSLEKNYRKKRTK